MTSNTYAVIMAGGSGTRFWPLSRKRKPKQVLKLFGENSLIQDTVARLEGIIPKEHILIVTNRQQYKLIASQLPGFSVDNFILEPSALNTAPCIGLAAIHIRRRNPHGNMVVLPSDHLIENIEIFKKRLQQGIRFIEQHDCLVTIGIPPTRPATGFGYVQIDTKNSDLSPEIFPVKAFAEKPNRSTAERFVAAGDFFWNAGIFIWRASRILTEMEEHLEEHYLQLNYISQYIGSSNYNRILGSHYNRMRAISIDYGIMEVSRCPTYMLTGDFGWSDVGSWDELYRLAKKFDVDYNAVNGDAVTYESSNNYIYSPDTLTAVIGMKDVMVINTPTATLICPRDRAQDVKNIVEKLRKEGRTRQL